MSFITEKTRLILANDTEFLVSYQCLLDENSPCSDEIKEMRAPSWLTFIVAGVSLLISTCLFTVHRRYEEFKGENWYRNTKVWKGALFQFFLNLCILGVLQAGHEEEWEEKGYEITGAVCLIAILITSLAFVLHKLKNVERTKEEKQRDKKRMEANDTFQDLGIAFSQAFLVFVGQAILLCMYIWALFAQGIPNFSDRRIHTFYWIGAILQAATVAGQNRFVLQAAKRFARSWRKIIDFAESGEASYASGNNNERYDIGKFRSAVKVRFVLSFLVNVAGYWVIIFGLPVQLSQSRNPYDFVLNAVAAYFITEIDDYDKPVKYEKVSKAEVSKRDESKVSAPMEATGATSEEQTDSEEVDEETQYFDAISV